MRRLSKGARVFGGAAAAAAGVVALIHHTQQQQREVRARVRCGEGAGGPHTGPAPARHRRRAVRGPTPAAHASAPAQTMRAGPRRDEARYQQRLRELAAAQEGAPEGQAQQGQEQEQGRQQQRQEQQRR